MPAAAVQYRSGGFSKNSAPQSLGTSQSPLRSIARATSPYAASS